MTPPPLPASKAVATVMALRQLRLARGCTLGAVSSFGALLAHISAGGAAPTTASIALAFGLSAALGLVVSGGQLNVIRVGAAAVLSQPIYHALYKRGHGVAGEETAGHHVEPNSLLSQAADEHSDMVGLHLLSAVVTIIYVTAVQRALDGVLRAVVRRFRLALELSVEVPRTWAPQRSRLFLVEVLATESIRRWVLRRGPPLLGDVPVTHP